MLNLRAKGLLALVLFAAAAPSFAATLVDTIPQWNGSSFISSFGPPNTQTYGQTITVPAGETTITGFRFVIQLFSGGPVQAEAFVYAWDTVNSRITGPALFTSAPVTISNPAFTQYTFSCNAPVVPGGVYVVFLSTSNIAQGVGGTRWGALTTDSIYAGGQFKFNNNGAVFANLSTTSWSFINEDLAFEVAFGGANLNQSPVPTLSGGMLALLGAALALVGFIALRFRTT